MAFNEMHRVPERPLEPNESKYYPAMSYEEEQKILLEFVRDNIEGFIEYIENYDRTLFGDFADTERWKWNKYKEENRINE